MTQEVVAYKLGDGVQIDPTLKASHPALLVLAGAIGKISKIEQAHKSTQARGLRYEVNFAEALGPRQITNFFPLFHDQLNPL